MFLYLAAISETECDLVIKSVEAFDITNSGIVVSRKFCDGKTRDITYNTDVYRVGAVANTLSGLFLHLADK